MVSSQSLNRSNISAAKKKSHEYPHEGDVNAQCELQHSSPPSAVRKSGEVQGFDHGHSS